MMHHANCMKVFVVLAFLLGATGIAAAQEPDGLEKVKAVYDSAAVVLAESRADALTYYERALDMAERLGDKGSELAEQCKAKMGELYLELGNEWLANEDIDKAVKSLKQAVEYGEEELANKLLSNIYIVKAVACQKMNDLKGALENAQKSVQFVDNPTAEKIVGITAFSLKQNKVAAEALEAYLSMKPDAITEEAGMVYNLGMALVATGENAKACGYFKEIAADPEFGMAARYQIVILKCE